jgi:secondary thiamine-phosphate synthase enzyme
MTVETTYIKLQTKGNGDVVDITSQVQASVSDCSLENGIVSIFTPSATSAITTLEYEPGCVEDLQRVFDDILSPSREYAHNQRWGDGNGHSHARAALLKPSLTVPFIAKELALGTWQQIILVDFDNRHRQRNLVVQLLGD